MSHLTDKRCIPSLSNDLPTPWWLRTPRQQSWREILGWRQRLLPPTMAESHTPSRIALYACSIANIDDEHAVSIV